MKQKDKNTNLSDRQEGDEENSNFKGYPSYSPGEDIFSKYWEEKEIDPENISTIKGSIENEKISTSSVFDSVNEISAINFDIPGSELDDQHENVGNEDEENDYYSIGGDDHEDLEEDQGS